MPLSEYEQRMLEQMERQLRSDDPKLADTLGSRRRAGVRVLLGTLAVLAGVGGLVAGVATQLPWLGVIGFLSMFGGVWVAVSAPQSPPATGGPVRAAGSRPGKPQRPGFMERLEDRWDRRRDGR